MKLHVAVLALLVVVSLALRPVDQKVPVVNDVISIPSAFGWRDCQPRVVVTAKHTEDVADAISTYYREATERGKRFSVRALTPNFLGYNNFSCPQGAQGVLTVAIDMSSMTEVVSWGEESITVQAGMTFNELQEVLLAKGMSLPGIIMAPTFGEMTVGAALVTASHGSSLVGPASLGPYLLSALLVDGQGQVHALDTPGDLLEGSAGLLGVVTEVTLVVVQARKVAVKQLHEEDKDIVGDLRDIIENSEALALDVTWSPAGGYYTARVWHDTEAEMSGESRSVWGHMPAEWLEGANRRLLADQVAHRDTGEVCTLLAELADRSHFSREDGWTEGDMYGVTVGWVNHMTSTSCGKNGLDCVWRAAQVTPYQVSITSEDFADWVEDVRAIMATAKGCPAFTITLRFVMESDAPMAMHSGRQVVSVELAAHGGRGATVPVRSGHLMEEILQMSLCKYEARPHWAHATNRLFTSPCPLRDTLGHDWDAFMEQRARYDPASLFTTPLFTAVANRGVGAMYPGCAVAGDCWCQDDSHCGARHKCVPGSVFNEYNVCMPETWTRNNEL